MYLFECILVSTFLNDCEMWVSSSNLRKITEVLKMKDLRHICWVKKMTGLKIQGKGKYAAGSVLWRNKSKSK